MKKALVIIIVLMACLLLAGTMFSCVNKIKSDNFIISFNTDGGSPVPSQRLTSKDTLVLPSPPTKDGFVFDAWYTDSNCQFLYNPNTFKINANATLYAKWIDVNLYPHQISVQAEGLILRVYESSVGLTKEQLSQYSDVDVELSKFRASKSERVAVSVRVWKEGYKLKDNSVKANEEIVTEGKFLMPAANVAITFELELTQYSITVNKSDNGVIIADKTFAAMGETINLNIIPDYGYKLDDLRINNVSITDTSFVMPAKNVLISSVFIKLSDTEYPITAIYSAGGILSLEKNSARHGEYVEVIAEPHEGYYLSYITINDKKLNDTYFIMPNKPANIEAVFLPIDYNTKYLLSKDLNIANGSIYTSSDSFAAGEKVILNSTALDGYDLSYYLVDSNPVFGDSFIMPNKNVSISAVFERKPYSIKKIFSGVGIITFSSENWAYYGDVIEVFVQPNEGYVLMPNSLRVNGTVLESNVFLMPNENVVVSANFVLIDTGNNSNQYTLTALPALGGTLLLSKNAADANDIIFITILPETGYRLKEGSITLNGEPCGYYFLMPSGNAVINAAFERIYNITFYHSSTGYVYADKQTAAKGEIVNIIYNAYGNNKIDGGSVYVNSIQIEENSFIMPANDVVLSANFPQIAIATYSITCVVPENGTISADLSSARAGWAVNIKAVPAAGYKLESLYYLDKNGKSVTISQTFYMPAESVGVRAVFVPDERTLNTENFFINNRLIYANNGGKLKYYSTPNSIKGFLELSGLQSYTGVVQSVLVSELVTDFVVLKLANITKAPYLAQKIAYWMGLRSGLGYSGGLYGDYLLITSCGEPLEDYFLLLSGLKESHGLILYLRQDSSYGVVSATASFQAYLAIPNEADGIAITRIGRRAFAKVQDIQTLSLGKVSILATEALYGLRQIKRLDLSRVKSIGANVFIDCVALERFDVESYNTVYATDSNGYALYEKQYNNKFGKLLRFAPSADISSYRIAIGCGTVAPYAFYGTKLKELYLTSVFNLSDYALYGMDDLMLLNTANLESAGYNSIYWNAENNLILEFLSPILIAANNGKALYKTDNSGGKLEIYIDKVHLLDNYRQNAIWQDYAANFILKKDTDSYFIIYYESNGGSYVKVATVFKSATADIPVNPVREGYIFDGWYTDNHTFNNRFNFYLSVFSDYRLYAKWIEE